MIQVQYEPDALRFLQNNNINVQDFTNLLTTFVNDNKENINPHGGQMEFEFQES